ncbi:MBL fold metallo-hydrolase [Dielma fastidiosa]|uniref:Cft2 family RNA processing exonuclease n=1 Tax=Dielma fastidiosa TaxID=1034346 RepID=A0A318KLB3_9FIRM|nr:MBL fold metallo-hydrolase [Dielma fastidiosa]PXX76065.1 Cft2 family RNA processing exonuclease [Dielma fastidiosa]
MIKLSVAGGIGEHGRNCFLIRQSPFTYILDCGLSQETFDPYPHLDSTEINQADFLIISHCHSDHAGAFQWLRQQGFQKPLLCTRATYELLHLDYDNTIFIDETFPRMKTSLCFPGLEIKWGRSGHCIGSIWLTLATSQSKLLYSGDYYPDSQLYYCDSIDQTDADLAIIDCAYATQTFTAADWLYQFNKLLERSNHNLLMPVPKNGRGLELAALILNQKPDLKLILDESLFKQYTQLEQNKLWLKPYNLKSSDSIRSVHLIGDPQIQLDKSRQLAEWYLKNGTIILSGTCYKDSYAEQISRQQHVHTLIYPIHPNLTMVKELIKHNHFKKVVLFHSQEIIEI